MPRAFAITPATPTVRLNASGQGEFSFTVSNALGKPVRARISLVPEGQTKREWLSIAGDAERDFPADGTQQVTVKISAPAGTPQGSYPFHPLVSTVTNPDEEYAEGATVSFDVAPSAPPPKPFPWWIVALVGGAIVIIAAAVLIVHALGGGLKLHEACDPKASKCGKALACTTLDGKSECLSVADKKCEAGKDCASGICREKKCVEPPPGANCASNADCPNSQKCVDVRPGVKACLAKQDQPCTGDLQCASAWCTDKKVCSRDDGRCTAATAAQDCRPNVLECKNDVCVLLAGQPCSQDMQCTTGFCSNGTCQPSTLCNPPCGAFFTCVRGVCQRLVFEPLGNQVLRKAVPLQHW